MAGTYMLPGELTVENVEKLRGELLERLRRQDQKDGAFVVEASNLVDIDAAGIQLLLSTALTCRERGLGFAMAGIPEDTEYWFKLSGALELLEEDCNDARDGNDCR